MDDRTDPTTPGDQELERRLEAYAEARLSPSRDSTTRMRTALMAAAHRQAALSAADPAGTAGETATTRVAEAPKRGIWKTWRRALTAVVIACLTVGILAGSALASQAGGPLYGARLWLEVATLPATQPARAEAEVKRLQARIDEAEEASEADDSGGTEAALVAYSAIVVVAAEEAAEDATARSTIESSVQLHVTVLTGLVTSAPPSARAAAQGALTQSTDTLRDLKGPGGTLDDPGSTPAAGGSGDGVQGAKGPAHPSRDGDSRGAPDGCAPTAEPSDGTVATVDVDAAPCDPSTAAPDSGTTGTGSGKNVKPDPTPRARGKKPPPGHQRTGGPAQPSHPVGRPDPAPNGGGKGSQQGKKGQGQVPVPCDSPAPGPDAHKP